MKSKTLLIILALTILLAATQTAHAVETPLVREFKAALYSRDLNGMENLIRSNRDDIPMEIANLLDDALSAQTEPRAREDKFYVVEFMASEYKRVTGDLLMLVSVKKRIFDSRLAPAVRLAPVNGVHVVDAMGHNLFKPDNIIIKKGETVRWVNKDSIGHLLASVAVIGDGGIFSPIIESNESWEHAFKTPGEYYYICFIHRVMYGKVTVEE